MADLNWDREILECIMNISEGRNQALIDSFGTCIQSAQGVKLLHLDANPDAHRTVITYVGHPEELLQVTLKLYRLALEKIDMRNHQGAHPRIGAIDVCPLVPLYNISREKAVSLSFDLAEAVGMLGIPVYLYQKSHRNPKYEQLETVRRGGYEALPTKLKSVDWIPDYGPSHFNPGFGATVIGVRELLIAYNISIDATIQTARKIASIIRSSGSAAHPGLLQAVKAIGWYMPAYNCCQISMNLTNFKQTSLHQVFAWTKLICDSLSIPIIGSEIIGLVPQQALIRAGKFGSTQKCKTKEECIYQAIKYLMLDWSGFKASEKILEYLMFD